MIAFTEVNPRFPVLRLPNLDLLDQCSFIRVVPGCVTCRGALFCLDVERSDVASTGPAGLPGHGQNGGPCGVVVGPLELEVLWRPGRDVVAAANQDLPDIRGWASDVRRMAEVVPPPIRQRLTGQVGQPTASIRRVCGPPRCIAPIDVTARKSCAVCGLHAHEVRSAYRAAHFDLGEPGVLGTPIHCSDPDAPIAVGRRRSSAMREGVDDEPALLLPETAWQDKAAPRCDDATHGVGYPIR